MACCLAAASLVQEGLGAARGGVRYQRRLRRLRDRAGDSLAVHPDGHVPARARHRRGGALRIIDWTDRGTCVLFGDGAGAVVLEASDRGGPLSFVLHSDGRGAKALLRPRTGRASKGRRHEGAWRQGAAARAIDGDAGCFFVQMDGKAISKFAVQAMEQATREALTSAGLTVNDIDLLVPHQANLRIIDATAKRLGLHRNASW